MCALDISNSWFLNNFAGYEGGAIKWNYYEPTMNLDFNKNFKNNSALVYGNNIASVAKFLNVTVQNNSTSKSVRLLQVSEVVVQSGGDFNVTLALFDKYNNIITTDSSSKLYVSTV